MESGVTFVPYPQQAGLVFGPASPFAKSTLRKTASLARLWLTDLNYTIHAACTLLIRNLMPEEWIQFDISNEGTTCLK